jgi:hypothetical protein
MRYFSRGFEHGCRFFVRQFQQGSHVAARDNTALTDLELHWGNDGTRELALRDQRDGSSSRQGFTDFTGVLLRQLDHGHETDSASRASVRAGKVRDAPPTPTRSWQAASLRCRR